MTCAAASGQELAPKPGASDPAPPESAANQTFARKPGYTPKVGDLVYLFRPDGKAAWAGRDFVAFMDAIKTRNANDKVGWAGMLERKEIAMIPSYSTVRVLEVRVVPVTVVPGRIDDFRGCEVRISSGPYEGRTAWVPGEFVTALVKVPKGRAARRVEAAKKGAPAPRVQDEATLRATLLKAAKNMEKDRNPKGARTFYQRIAVEYPGTDEADVAKARIDAIEKALAEAAKKED